eukprot:1055420-Pelagomonas_calceolata.AAC.2
MQCPRCWSRSVVAGVPNMHLGLTNCIVFLVPGFLAGSSLGNYLDQFFGALWSQLLHLNPAQALFRQLFSFMNVQLFNQLLLRRECCSFSNGEYVKTGLLQVSGWLLQGERAQGSFKKGGELVAISRPRICRGQLGGAALHQTGRAVGFIQMTGATGTQLVPLVGMSHGKYTSDLQATQHLLSAGNELSAGIHNSTWVLQQMQSSLCLHEDAALHRATHALYALFKQHYPFMLQPCSLASLAVGLAAFKP